MAWRGGEGDFGESYFGVDGSLEDGVGEFGWA